MTIIAIIVFILMCLVFLVALFKDIVKTHFLHKECDRVIKKAQLTTEQSQALSKRFKNLLK